MEEGFCYILLYIHHFTEPRRMTDTTQIQELVNTYVAAWAQGDSELYASVFSDNTDFVSIRHDIGHTRAEMVRGHSFIFANLYQDTYIEAEITKLRFLESTVAILFLTHEIFNKDGEPAVGMGGNPGNTIFVMAVVKKFDDGWKIEAMQNMVPVSL